MEEQSAFIPAKFEAIPVVNGHRTYRRHPPASSSSSTSSSSAATDFDLVSPSYTSIKDLLLPSTPALLSPTPAADSASAAGAGASTLEISIRNRLVKQAAWAYLQPMASSPSASGRRLLSYFSGDFVRPFLSSIKRALLDWAARACNWLSDALWLLLCR